MSVDIGESRQGPEPDKPLPTIANTECLGSACPFYEGDEGEPCKPSRILVATNTGYGTADRVPFGAEAVYAVYAQSCGVDRSGNDAFGTGIPAIDNHVGEHGNSTAHRYHEGREFVGVEGEIYDHRRVTAAEVQEICRLFGRNALIQLTYFPHPGTESPEI